MPCAQPTLKIKAILKEFVAHLESAVSSGERNARSPFEQAVSPKLLAQMEVALCADRSPDEQVVLLTNGTPARALVAGSVLQQSGLTMDRIVTELDEDVVEMLASCIRRLKVSRLLLLDASSLSPPRPGEPAVRYLMLGDAPR